MAVCTSASSHPMTSQSSPADVVPSGSRSTSWFGCRRSFDIALETCFGAMNLPWRWRFAPRLRGRAAPVCAAAAEPAAAAERGEPKVPVDETGVDTTTVCPPVALMRALIPVPTSSKRGVPRCEEWPTAVYTSASAHPMTSQSSPTDVVPSGSRSTSWFGCRKSLDIALETCFGAIDLPWRWRFAPRLRGRGARV